MTRFPLSAMAVGLMSLTSCSFYNVTTQVEVLSAPGQDSVEVSLEMRGWDETESFEFIGYDWVDIGLDNYVEGHILRAERPGYYPDNLPVFRERSNRWKGVDLGLGLVFTRPLVEHGDEPWAARQWTQAISLGYNVLGFALSPWRVYDKSFTLPKLEPLPEADDAAPPVWIEGVHIDIAPGKHVTEHYRNRNAYYANRLAFTFSNEEAFEMPYTNLDEDALERLWEQGYQGPNGGSLFTMEDEMVLEAAIVGVQERQIGNLAQYTVHSQWWVYNPYGLASDTVEYFTRTTWGFASGVESPFDRQALADAVVKVCFDAAENPKLRQDATRKDTLEAQWKADWEPIVIDAVSAPSGKLASALSSVVTIEDETGHGSGCVLSSDGFILTNHHVVLDTQLVHTVHFHDGTSLEAKIVRYHPLYDLALLKVDTTGLVPFQTDLRLETVEIGDDVFAMGTPYDVDLGASVTRGIVSAIRKDGKRNLIQTDVSISPGNSGGALVRGDGTLIGVVNEKIMELGVEGIGFAIPLHFIEDALMVRYREGR